MHLLPMKTGEGTIDESSLNGEERGREGDIQLIETLG